MQLEHSSISAEPQGWLRDYALPPSCKALRGPQLVVLLELLSGSKTPPSWDPGGTLGQDLARLASTRHLSSDLSVISADGLAVRLAL